MAKSELQKELVAAKKELTVMRELAAIKKELAALKEAEEMLTAKEIAPKMKKSASYVYKLLHLAKDLKDKGKDGGIPFIEPSPGTFLFSWPSVNQWLHELEKKKEYWNFED